MTGRVELDNGSCDGPAHLARGRAVRAGRRRTAYAYATQVLATGLCLFATVGLVSRADPWTSPSDTRDGLSREAPSLTPALDDNPMTVQIARSTKMDATCTPPTLARGSQCVLEGDVTLTATLELASDTTLNCRGHKIVPVSVGSGSTRSQPEIGILLIAVQNSRLQNCVLDGFDFGVFAAGSKVSPEIRNNPGALARRRNSLVSNVINARFFGIQMFNVDNTEIKGNAITFKSPGGIGIEVTRDSDLNQIRNNAVVGSFSPPIDPAPMAPGPSNPPIFSGGGLVIFVAQLGSLSLIPTLANVIVGGELYQFPVSIAERSEDNLVEENTIIENVHSSVSPIQGIGTSQAIGTTVRRNKIVRASTGITLNGADGTSAEFPGACSLDSSRLCLKNGDCSIPGIDTTSKGSCMNVAVREVGWPGEQYRVEDNHILETSTMGINVVIANNSVVSGNSVSSAAGRGIALGGGPALETSTIAHNVIRGVRDALFLNRTQAGVTASFFGAKVSLNDFTGYVNAVLTSNDYDLPSDLSVDGRGNHWGLTCAEGGFDPGRVRRQNGTANPSVVDTHPYGESVAQSPDEQLPQPCSE